MYRLFDFFSFPFFLFLRVTVCFFVACAALSLFYSALEPAEETGCKIIFLWCPNDETSQRYEESYLETSYFAAAIGGMFDIVSSIDFSWPLDCSSCFCSFLHRLLVIIVINYSFTCILLLLFVLSRNPANSAFSFDIMILLCRGEGRCTRC